MRLNSISVIALALFSLFILAAQAQEQRVEVSDDGQEIVVVKKCETDGTVTTRGRGVPYGAAPDWQNDLRRQVGGLQAVDMNGNGLVDVVVGCYHSDSYPPYDDWENLIYYNIGGELEASPSWGSTDEVSSGDIQVADINDDTYPDIFAANGYYTMDASVIYWGSPTGPSPTPGWYSAEPGLAWNNYAMPFDLDHDGDVDVVTANQGNSPSDPYRPIYVFYNTAGVLETVPSWQSAELSIQGFLALADYDGDELRERYLQECRRHAPDHARLDHRRRRQRQRRRLGRRGRQRLAGLGAGPRSDAAVQQRQRLALGDLVLRRGLLRPQRHPLLRR